MKYYNMDAFRVQLTNDIRKLLLEGKSTQPQLPPVETTELPGDSPKTKQQLRKIRSEEDFVKLQVPWIM